MKLADRTRALSALAFHTLREQLLSRSYQLIVVFGAVLIYAAILFSVMAVDQAARVLLDFGLALIELFALAAAVYGASTTVLREMETKTIHLILTRPVSKGDYLIGRFLGLLASTAAAMAAMGAVHAALLLYEGWTFTPVYLLLLAGSFLKVAVIASVASLLALFSTSVVTAVNLTIVLWVLGHFMPEARFMTRKLAGPGAPLMDGLLDLLPNLQVFNLKDRFSAPGAASARLFGASFLYALVYASACLGLAHVLFKRKEF